MATVLSVLSNRMPIVAVLAALAEVVLKAMQVVLHRVADLSFRVVGRKEEVRVDAYAVELGMGAGLLSFLEKNRRDIRFFKRDLGVFRSDTSICSISH
ncbi:hypothetical protein [Bacillus sp. JAS24-2]|uniref:hypothetical protein n=1 Tax=Bacillus sp. JAS24-2 TaxID=2217832 RepID=UPI0021041B15|nr:hypothetical protein [Bacillus sp. JAS24-2]